MSPSTDDERYIDTIIAQAERRSLEFKEARNRYDTEKAVAYCAAIANEGGGLLVLGITDTPPREVVGTAAFGNLAGVELLLHEKLGLRVPIREALYQTKRVLVFQIPSRRPGVPVAYDGRYYLRAGESLIHMTPHQIAEILDEAQGSLVSREVKTDLEPKAVAELLDIDAFFRLITDTRPADIAGVLDVLANRGLVSVVQRETNYSITALGALFLARDLSRFPTLHWRRVRFIKYASTDRVDVVLEKFENRGYGVSFEDLLELVQAHIPVREVFNGGLRTTIPIYPPTAIREFLANALVHQDLYENGVQITIEIFTDRIEIRNPGKPLIDVTRFVDESRARNNELAEIMRVARICEIRGSGVDRALAQIEDYLQPAPSFKAETAATAVVLYSDLKFDDMTIEERIWATFLHCCVRYAAGDRLTNTTLRQRFGLSGAKTTLVSQTIAAAVEAGLIKLDPRVGSSKRHAKYMPFFGA